MIHLSDLVSIIIYCFSIAGFSSALYEVVFFAQKKDPPITRRARKIKLYLDYSMMVATRPDPTVRQPSRSSIYLLQRIELISTVRQPSLPCQKIGT